jgi:hypothetical protein
MRHLISRHPWRHPGTDVLVILTGFAFALLCGLLVLAEVVFKLFVLLGLGLCGIAVAIVGHFKKSVRHA